MLAKKNSWKTMFTCKACSLQHVRKLKSGQCSKYFKVKHNLSQHVKRIHEKLHMVQCEHCSRHFGCKSNLNEHKKIIHFRGQGF